MGRKKSHNSNLMHRVVILIAFIISIAFFFIRLFLGYELLDTLYFSAFMMLALSIFLLLSLQFIVKIMFEYLAEKKRQTLSSKEPNDS